MIASNERSFDVAVIGASFAGSNAALFLARARRSVIVFDTGEPRNRFASEGHGFLGMDGAKPADIQERGQADFLKYPTTSLVKARVTGVAADGGRFAVTAEKDAHVVVDRVVLAHGNEDVLPDLPGLADCWGKTVLQCPYCHGYEVSDRPTGLLMSGAPSLHQARLLGDWTNDLTLFTNGHVLEDEDRADLARRGVTIADGEVTGIARDGDQMRSVRLADGTKIGVEVLYLITRSRFRAPFAHMLGCSIEEGPFGPFIVTDDLQETSVPGVYAAGDITRPAYGATWAAADGTRAGAFSHQSLIAQANPYVGHAVTGR
ncbi:MAG: NAD(P)/FAD-dependent oxidoreductase [Pseudomonadota bacterium]